MLADGYLMAEIDRAEWDRHWTCVRRANLLQSWEYGEAKATAERWRAVRFLIADRDGRPLALAQLLIRSLPLLGGIARLNRGPLLLAPFADQLNAPALQVEVLHLLLREARRRHWWLLQAAPELVDDENNESALRALGMRRQQAVAWASARLSLCEDEQTLLESLHGKWRNLLRKSQKTDLVIDNVALSAMEMDILLQCYREMQQQKGFVGLGESLLRRLLVQQGPAFRVRVLKASMVRGGGSTKILAGLVVSVEHGDCATYLIAYTNVEGRRLQANYLLLWEAIRQAKNAGCAWFDLGGINAHTPPGIAHFKNGLRGDPYASAGEWRRYNL